MLSKVRRAVRWIKNALRAPARLARISEFQETIDQRLAAVEASLSQIHAIAPHTARAHEVYKLTRQVESLHVLLGQVRSAQLQNSENVVLRDKEFKVFSQFGDDGIIDWLVSNLDIPNKSFIEFGVEDYSESNTRFLLINRNWKGLIIDGSSQYIEAIKNSELYWKHDLTAICEFIDAENINRIFAKNGMTGEIGLLSIDIDGNDFWVWKAINTVNPIIVVAEFNSVFGPDAKITVPYNPKFERTKAHHSNLYFGASIAALCELAKTKGYSFVGCNTHGNNAYFVRNDKLGRLRALSSGEGYVQSRYRESRDENGNLTFVSDDARRELIQHLPVYEISSDQTVQIKNTPIGTYPT